VQIAGLFIFLDFVVGTDAHSGSLFENRLKMLQASKKHGAKFHDRTA